MEDDREQAELLAELLQAFGHTVVITHDADQALHRYKQQHFDILITDIIVSTESGPRGGILLIGRIRLEEAGTHRRIPIITISGALVAATHPSAGAQMQIIGADTHFEKPVSPQKLHEEILRLLEIAEKSQSGVANA
ncbi:response regulator [uncultured Cohaesibacter sp.]|uniref:response regulator n=1 Tax=uncultured Cohaesibacter sp. TaxID=1002546 RepID=UPI0029C68180|nr:response regulator [uncultured Cohaesibacter sp.]